MADAASDKIFWLAFCKAIKQIACPTIGPNSAIFFGTKALKGPLASPLIPEEYTNYGIYQIANNLLPVDNLFYVPSSDDSYIRSLKTYLSYVDLGANQNDAVIGRLVLAQQALRDAEDYYRKARKVALADFQEEQAAGMTGGLTFQQWFPTHSHDLINAKAQKDAAASQVKAVTSELHGPLAIQYNKDLDIIDLALEGSCKNPGITMSVSSATPPTAAVLRSALQTGKALNNPDGIYHVPLYSSPQYVYTVKDWYNTPSGGKTGANSVSISLSSGRDVKEGDFGQESFGGGLSFNFVPWISFGVGDSDEKRLDGTKFDENDIDITLTYDQMEIVPITPGKWNIGNPKSSYPKLKPDAPKEVRTLVVPSAMVIAKNLGYKVTLKSSIKSTFDKKVEDTVAAGGHVRIFGVPIKVGAGYEDTSETSSHSATWDKASGTFEAVPTDDGATATVVAILGNKVKTY